VYDNVGLVYDAAGVRTATADGLNPPEAVSVYGPAGALSWSWSVGTGATYIVDTARQNEGSPAGAADVFAMSLGGSAPTTVAGLSSTAAAPTPAWTTPLPGCSADNSVGGTYTGIQAADDGSLVAVQCVDSASSPPSARVYALDGQTGAVKWYYDATVADGVKVGQGQVQVTGDGAWVLFVNEQGVPTPNTAEAYVLDGRTGALRGNVTIPFFITAAISDSGNYLIVGDESVAHVNSWSAATGAYAPAFDITPPTGPQVRRARARRPRRARRSPPPNPARAPVPCVRAGFRGISRSRPAPTRRSFSSWAASRATCSRCRSRPSTRTTRCSPTS